MVLSNHESAPINQNQHIVKKKKSNPTYLPVYRWNRQYQYHQVEVSVFHLFVSVNNPMGLLICKNVQQSHLKHLFIELVYFSQD